MLRPLWILLAIGSLGAAPPDKNPHPAALVGIYDGGQMEMAAGIELKADGRFRYALSYGALDEEDAGTWAAEGDDVVLTSDKVVAPRIVFEGQDAAPPGELHVALTVPKSLNRQLFETAIWYADGHVGDQQLGDDETVIAFPANNPPARIAIGLPMFNVSSAAVPIAPGKGARMRFRFEANDLGKADLTSTRLRHDGQDLVFERFDRTIRFRRHAGSAG